MTCICSCRPVDAERGVSSSICPLHTRLHAQAPTSHGSHLLFYLSHSAAHICCHLSLGPNPCLLFRSRAWSPVGI